MISIPGVIIDNIGSACLLSIFCCPERGESGTGDDVRCSPDKDCNRGDPDRLPVCRRGDLGRLPVFCRGDVGSGDDGAGNPDNDCIRGDLGGDLAGDLRGETRGNCGGLKRRPGDPTPPVRIGRRHPDGRSDGAVGILRLT